MCVLAAAAVPLLPRSVRAANATTYTATETIPVPPASAYAGAGGGDGWAVALSNTDVYNVFHHDSVLEVACHLQADASQCWSPEVITDSNGNNFATSGQPGLYLDQTSGRLYVYATRVSDATGGVVCIDTNIAATNPDPFCGFTALDAAGDSPINGGISFISDPMRVAGRWYAFNFVAGAATPGAQNSLFCFDLTTFGQCAGQPYAVVAGLSASSPDQDFDFPPPATTAIGSRLIIPVTAGGSQELACFDTATLSNCALGFPLTLGFSYNSFNGASYPLLDASGAVSGVCLPTGTDQCFDFNGNAVATPAGMPAAIPNTSGWDGPSFVLGPRVYLPDGNRDQVECFDYSTGQDCSNFPKVMNNLGLLYTVNADPQRPTCIWVNSDDGVAQIQNFDAYSAGGCGQGPIRVLASSFVVPSQLCVPTSYVSLQVVAPPPTAYTDGTVAFEDGDGNPIAGLPTSPLDGSGSVSLAGLNLNTGTGLPEFLVTLNGTTNRPSSVTVQLTWQGVQDPSCTPGGAPTPNVVFVHGINGNFVGLQNAALGDDPNDQNWIELLQPLAGSSNLSIFPYYQDAGYSPVGTPNVQCNGVGNPVLDPASKLYLDPNRPPFLGVQSSGYCDSQSALALNAQALDVLVRSQSASVVVANSMGGAITRGWMAYAQSKDPSDTSPEMTQLKDIVFLQGAQEGSWIAGGGAAIQSAFGAAGTIPVVGALAGKLENIVTQHIGFDPRRPGTADLAPVSNWYQSVNPSGLYPPNVNYYNVATNEQVVVDDCVLFYCWNAGTINAGDIVMLPGQNSPTSMPAGGGSGFLPVDTSGFTRQEYVIGHQYTFNLFGIVNDISAVQTLIGDKASHFNFGSHANDATAFTVQACNSTQQVTVTNFVLQIVGGGC